MYNHKLFTAFNSLKWYHKPFIFAIVATFYVFEYLSKARELFVDFWQFLKEDKNLVADIILVTLFYIGLIFIFVKILFAWRII